MSKGTILPARTIDTRKGLITESGGPLSHGAVTARGIGLAAVMSVGEVMSRLKDGQVVMVDGT